jgi:lipopolysaccharide export system permease protein
MNKFNNKLIFRNFFNDVTGIFLVLLLSFGLIVWVIQAVNFLDFVTEDGHGLLVYIKFTLLNLPKIFSRLIPIIFFISIFYIINKYEDNNELKIFWLVGVNRIEFINKLIKYSIFFTFILLILNTLLVPASQNKARKFIQSSNIDFFPSLIREKKFIDTVEGLTIFIEKKNNKFYENIFIKDDKITKKKIIYAKKGQLINNEKERSLRLEDGKIINIYNSNITEFDFKNTTIDLSNYITKSITDFKVQEKKTSSLINCYWNYFILNKNIEYFDPNNCNDPAIKEIQSELYKRMIKPMYLILLSILSGYILLFSKENAHNKRYRLIVFLSGVFLIIISELFNSFLHENYYFLHFSLIFPFILFICLYWILKKNNLSKISQ